MKFLIYNRSYFDECLQLFDENCPEYFAENERQDYIGFLNKGCSDYLIGVSDGFVAAAFGVISNAESSRARLVWIMVSPKFKGSGIGVQMMNHAKKTVSKNKSSAIDIAASQLSAPFFAKFGAIELNRVQNGWGPDMHRIDMEIRLK